MKKDVVGIICEYNPFHNGHLYHLSKVKELFPNSLVVLVMSSCFTERGEISLLNKWDKTNIALTYGVDIVIELPFFYATNSADYFANGSIKILNELNCNYLVFGSEINDIDKLNKIADIQINNKEYDNLVKEYLDKGNNYPTSLSLAIKDLIKEKIDTPNDLLAISYLKQIKLLNSNIKPISIKRTNNYHDKEIKNVITSATSIREALNNNQDIKEYVPIETYNSINKIDYLKYFNLLKYKILSDNNLDRYLDINEGLDKRIKKAINKANNLDELINLIKTKRYTYNKINRLLLHIYTGTTKDEVDKLNKLTYIRVLGFTSNGKKYIKEIRNNTSVPIITNYHELDDYILDNELKVTNLYNYLINKEELNIKELKSIPIIK